MEHARGSSGCAARRIHVIVNYETTVPDHRPSGIDQRAARAGEIRKMLHGRPPGPKEIHVQPEFLAWLTDPVKNGAGHCRFRVLRANLMTWLMDNQRRSPSRDDADDETKIYSRVDEATILVEYPKAQGSFKVVELAV